MDIYCDNGTAIGSSRRYRQRIVRHAVGARNLLMLGGDDLFEVVEIGPFEKKRFLRRQSSYRPIKLRCVQSARCEKLGRTFEGHGHYSAQTYRAEFSEGEVISIWVSGLPLLAVGDRLGLESLAAQGWLDDYFRLVATTG